MATVVEAHLDNVIDRRTLQEGDKEMEKDACSERELGRAIEMPKGSDRLRTLLSRQTLRYRITK